MQAVHIEVPQTMETDPFNNSLQCFMAKHGKPEEMRSDNSANFKRGNCKLTEAIKQWNPNKLNAFSLQEEIRWYFNPPHASHQIESTGKLQKQCFWNPLISMQNIGPKENK